MRDDQKAMAIQVDSQIIELGSGDSVVCMEGAIWATTAKIACEFAPIDEFLYPGDSLISCIEQSYCISNLRQRMASYAVIKSTCASALRVQSKVHQRRDDGYLLVRSWAAFSRGGRA